MILDMSAYDLPTFDADCFKASGVEGVILGVYTALAAPGMMGYHAEKLIAAGVPVVGFYGLIYFGDAYGEVRDTQWAIELAKKYGVERVWLDCEIDANGVGWNCPTPTPEQRVEAIRKCVALVEGAGLSVGIYTGGWWWPGKTLSSDAFSHLPLWHAAYPEDGREIRRVNYGGWSEVSIHQYTSSLNVCGRNRDANYVFDESVLGGDMGLSKEDIVALFGSTERDEQGNLLSIDQRYEFAKPRYELARDSGVSLLEQVGGANANLKDHIANHAAGVSGPIPPHTHKPGGVQ